jgi:hypothetical protein
LEKDSSLTHPEVLQICYASAASKNLSHQLNIYGSHYFKVKLLKKPLSNINWEEIANLQHFVNFFSYFRHFAIKTILCVYAVIAENF